MYIDRPLVFPKYGFVTCMLTSDSLYPETKHQMYLYSVRILKLNTKCENGDNLHEISNPVLQEKENYHHFVVC